VLSHADKPAPVPEVKPGPNEDMGRNRRTSEFSFNWKNGVLSMRNRDKDDGIWERNNHSRQSHLSGIRNEEGFTAVLLAVFLMIVATLTGLGAQVFILAQSQQRANHLCDQLALGSQSEVEQPINKLLRLNRAARALSARHKLLQGQLALAIGRGDLTSAGAIQIKIKMNQIKRQALDLTQKQLITQAESAARAWYLLAQRKLRSTTYKAYLKIPLVPVGEPPAPEYHLAIDFVAKTVISAQGKGPLAGSQGLTFSWKCSSSFEFSGSSVRAHLGDA